MRFILAAILPALLFAACLPEPKTGCRTTDDCAPGRVCVAGTCQPWRRDAGTDAGADKQPSVDVAIDFLGTLNPDLAAGLDGAPDLAPPTADGAPDLAPEAADGAPDLAPPTADGAPDLALPAADVAPDAPAAIDAPDNLSGLDTRSDRQSFEDAAIGVSGTQSPDLAGGLDGVPDLAPLVVDGAPESPVVPSIDAPAPPASSDAGSDGQPSEDVTIDLPEWLSPDFASDTDVAPDIAPPLADAAPDAPVVPMVDAPAWDLPQSGIDASDAHGGGEPTASGNPREYTRSDNLDAIVFRSPDSHVIEIVASAATDLTNEANASVIVLGDPWGYKRSDSKNTVVYRGGDNHIHELSKESSWKDGDLTTMSGGSPAQGNPMGYARSDNVDAVIYRGTDNHLHENGLRGSVWEYSDLTSVSGLHSSLAGDPIGYVRTDDVNTVVYRATDNHIHELALTAGGAPPWVDTDLFAASGETVSAAGDPWGYQRGDAYNEDAVVYLGADGNLHELLLTLGSEPTWVHATLPAAQPTGTPSGYVRWDGKAAVVYRSATTPPTIREILLDGTWSDGSLDAVDHPSAGPSGNPVGRRATNNMDSVVYLGTDSGVYEQRLGLTVTWNFVRY